jgi:hypothetical protein
MKTKLHFLRLMMILMPTMGAIGAMAQSGPYPNTGTQSVCLTGTSEPYGVVNTTGSTYTWTISGGGSPTDWVLTSTNTNLASILWKNAGIYTVQVMEMNTNGCTNSLPVTVVVTVYSLPVPVIAGNTVACLNSTGNIYTTEAGMTGYAWIISTGGTITNGGTAADNTVTVTWNISGPQSVSVNYNNVNNCAAITPTVKTVTVNTLPTTSPIYHN